MFWSALVGHLVKLFKWSLQTWKHVKPLPSKALQSREPTTLTTQVIYLWVYYDITQFHSTIIVKLIFSTIYLVSFNSTRNHWRSPSISSIRHLELWCSPLCSFVRTTSIQGWKCRREQGQYFERKVQVWMALQGSDYGSNSIAHVDL